MEHEGFLYSSDISTRIRCQSEQSIHPIEQMPIDQGCSFVMKFPKEKTNDFVSMVIFREILAKR